MKKALAKGFFVAAKVWLSSACAAKQNSNSFFELSLNTHDDCVLFVLQRIFEAC